MTDRHNESGPWLADLPTDRAELVTLLDGLPVELSVPPPGIYRQAVDLARHLFGLLVASEQRAAEAYNTGHTAGYADAADHCAELEAELERDDDARERLASVEADRHNLQNLVADLKTRLDDARERLVETEHELALALEGEQDAELDVKLELAEDRADREAEQARRWKSAAEHRLAEIEKWKTKERAARSDASTFANRLARCQADLERAAKEATDRKKEHERAMAAADRTLARYRAKLSAAESADRLVGADLETASQAINERNAAMDRADALEVRLAQVTAERDGAREARDQAQRSVGHLKTKLDGLKDLEADLLEQRNALDARVGELTAALERCQAKLAKFEDAASAKLKTARAKLDRAVVRAAKAEAKLVDLETELADLRHGRDKLAAALRDEVHRERLEGEKRLEALDLATTDEIEVLQAKLQHARDEGDAAAETAAKVQAKLETAHQLATERLDQAEDARRERDRLAKALEISWNRPQGLTVSIEQPGTYHLTVKGEP